MCQACVGALHRADRRRAPDVNRLLINLHCTRQTHNAHQSQAKPAPNPSTRVAPSQRAARTNRKPNPHQTRTCALHRANRRRTPDASQLCINSHMCIAPSRYAARTRRKSTPCRTRALALHRADRRRTPNVSQLRVNPHMRVASSRQAACGKCKSTSHQFAHMHCIEPTGGAHQT